MRDWSSSLFPASFRGVAFEVEKTERTVGRRLVKHQYPYRDDPLIEDLGEDIATLKVTAYLVSDSADADADDLFDACAREGAGVLVLPDLAPLTVRCERASRDFSRDQLGYIAVSLDFVREGASSDAAPVSFLALANAIVVQVQGWGALLGEAYLAATDVVGRSSSVIDAAREASLGIVAALELVRSDVHLAAAHDASSHLQLKTCAAVIVSGVNASAGVSGVPFADLTGVVVSVALGTSGAGKPDLARAAFAALDDVLTPDPDLDVAAFVVANGPYAGASSRIATRDAARLIVNQAAADRCTKALALGGLAVALTEIAFSSRREAIAARADFAERVDRALLACHGAVDAAIYADLLTLQGRVSDYLSRKSADLAPVLVVSAPARLPAVLIAWQLYADPSRYPEIAARNLAEHPGFLPQTFEVLAA